MFIVWGTKRVDAKLGYAADFCYVCRDVRPFSIFRVGMASHLYFVTAGPGKVAGHFRECTHCHCRLNAAPDNYLEVLTRPGGVTMSTLIAKTFPNVRNFYAKRLELESTLKKNPASLDQQTRAQLLAEPFQLMAPVVDARFAKTHLDFTMAGIFIAAFVLCIVIANVIRHFYPDQIDAIPMLVLPILAAGGGGMIIQSLRSGRSYMRESIYPAMSLALRPLQPQEAELKTLAGNILKKSTKFKRKLNLHELMKFVNQAGHEDHYDADLAAGLPFVR